VDILCSQDIRRDKPGRGTRIEAVHPPARRTSPRSTPRFPTRWNHHHPLERRRLSWIRLQGPEPL